MPRTMREAILRGLPHYTGASPADFHAWLATIADRVYGRRDALCGNESCVVSTDDLLDGADPGDGPEERLLRAEQLAMLGAGMKQLPDHDRRVVEMRVLHQVPVADIAEQLDRPAGTIRMTQTRALRRLLQTVEQQGAPGTPPSLQSESVPSHRCPPATRTHLCQDLPAATRSDGPHQPVRLVRPHDDHNGQSDCGQCPDCGGLITKAGRDNNAFRLESLSVLTDGSLSSPDGQTSERKEPRSLGLRWRGHSR